MRGTTRNNTVSDEDGEVPESTTTFAKQRTKAEIEQDRARRLGREMRAAGVHEADSALQALYIFIDEPGSSIAARIFSVVIVLTILTSSILFVAETHSFFKSDPSCRPVFCDSMVMQARPERCEEVEGCTYTFSSCGAVAADICNSMSLHDNRTACLAKPGCTHSAVASCSAPVFGTCGGDISCEFVPASGGTADACVPAPGNCTYEAVQCDGADMQAGQEECEADEACAWSLGFCGADAVCLGTDWPAELSGTDTVIDSVADSERQALCTSTSGCFYTNRLAWMHLIEAACILLFTVEYVLKLISCTARPDKPLGPNGEPRNPVIETLNWATETMNAIDLLAILPWWVGQLTSSDINIGSPILRMFRMVRVFRILKFGGHVRNLQLFAIGMKRAQEGLMLLLFLLILYLCVFAAVLYQLEYDDQREAGNTGFTSIPTTWYYIMATMTTVGYGDHYPITPAGQLVGGACMICGIFVLGLPIVVVGNTFDEVFKEEEDEVARAKEAAKRLEKKQLEAVATENPLSKDAEAEQEQQEPSFNVDVAIHAMAELMENLYTKTGNDRFDAAFHRLVAAPKKLE